MKRVKMERSGREAPAGMTGIEPLRTVYSAWQRGDFRPRADVYHHEMAWGWSAEFPGLAGVVRDSGPRSARLLRWLSSWEQWRVEPEETSRRASSSSCSLDTWVVARKAASRWTRPGRTSGGCAMARPFASRSSPAASGRSTPLDCERGLSPAQFEPCVRSAPELSSPESSLSHADGRSSRPGRAR